MLGLTGLGIAQLTKETGGLTDRRSIGSRVTLRVLR
jgi:hypothetical protein